MADTLSDIIQNLIELLERNDNRFIDVVNALPRNRRVSVLGLMWLGRDPSTSMAAHFACADLQADDDVGSIMWSKRQRLVDYLRNGIDYLTSGGDDLTDENDKRRAYEHGYESGFYQRGSDAIPYFANLELDAIWDEAYKNGKRDGVDRV